MPDQIAADPISDYAGLAVPPLDDSFFSDDINNSLLFFNDNNNVGDVDDDVDVFNFDFTFDDVVHLPSDNFADPDCFPVDVNVNVNVCSDLDDSGSNTESHELTQLSDDPNFNVAGYFNVDGENENEIGIGIENANSSGNVPKISEVVRVCCDDASQVNVSSSDSRDWSSEIENKNLKFCGDSDKIEARKEEVSGHTSSQGSDNCERSVGSSMKLDEKLSNNVVDWKIKVEEIGKNSQVLKRKNEDQDVISESTRTIKYRRSANAVGAGGCVTTDESNVFSEMNDDDEKRKTRLMRNRESAQLSRQRKKHYVEELEDKVRAMHSTIQDLNAKISYIVAENASLRQQQMNGGGGVSVGVGAPPMQGMYPHPHPPMAPMGYPWMPCPPYMLKPQGSQVPLVPIPRLKPQQPAVKPVKKEGSKKNVGKSKTKKVASVSFLGVLFFMLLFGGLVPMVNVRYGGIRDAISGGSGYIGNGVYDQRHERILMVNGTNHEYGSKGSDKKFDTWKDHVGGAELNMKQSGSDEFASSGNASDPLVASLYVPRNDKLVKIDGNLIIHSVLASEKAKASHADGKAKSDRETSLALALHLSPHVQGAGQNDERQSHIYRSTIEQQRALASGSGGKDNLKSTPANGKLQQWFREGLAGPMLSSGMCTEVFQFDVSPSPGAIVPATPGSRNIAAEERKNSTHLIKGRNRRILHGLSVPLAGSANNISEENNGSNSQEEKFHRNSSVSPMIVSVLVDPREVGDADVDGTIGTKSISRIFVVVLLDSVKYVTYSCMLPFKGSSHLVTA
ncbi:BZIP domain-containing protein [Heracleum sosnowskyi]|uniref:BZIP domain-containing protein n=1 Tax=Heracleum sosnowskyi TaxID=360622 RepID=A0AAD8IMK2_9APIA|nr:BZIP domain-containing protein [Heracleum sosnowskyi]